MKKETGSSTQGNTTQQKKEQSISTCNNVNQSQKKWEKKKRKMQKAT